MTGMTQRLLLLGLVLGVCLTACAPESRAADYGVKVSFKKDVPVKFPDFVLTYLGERKVASDRYPRGFTFHDFRIAAGAGTQTVSWNSGTGDIGPALFQAGSKQFGLELSRSDKVGSLKANEVVITRAP
jgi:hypothetical protein